MFAVSPVRAERKGSVRRNGGGGHLQNILLLRAALQQAGVIVVDARSAADAAAKDDTRLADGAVRQPAVAHGLVGRMQAKADGAVIFGRGEVLTVHLRSHMGDAALRRDGLDLVDPGFPAQIFCQQVSTSLPAAQIRPRPVMTQRFSIYCSTCSST